MSNPFQTLEDYLARIEVLLLDIKNPPKETENKLHSVKSLSISVGVSELTVRNWIAEGKIKAKRIGRKIFIEQSQFEKGLEDVKSLKYKR